MPRETRADVPSGKTSQSLTDSEAAGWSAETRIRATGCPTTGPEGGSRSQVSERASSSRWSPDRPHGRWPAQSIQAAVPTSAMTGRLAVEVSGAATSSRRRRGRYRRQPQPVALVQVEVRLRPGRGTHEDVTAVLVRTCPAQPVVEPASQLGVEVDPGSGHRGRRVGVGPRPGEQPVRRSLRRQPLDGPEGVVAVAVGPARHDHRRHLDPLVPDGRPAEPHRPVVPVLTMRGLAQPGEHPRLVGLEPAQPLLLPPVSPDGRHGRQHVHRGHVVVVVDEIDQPKRTAAPVHVIGPAVVGGVDRADRLQLRRSLAGHLQRVEPGVRRAPHADLPVAPLLRGQPGHHLGEVALLVGLVLVERVAARRPGAAQVEPAHGVPMAVAEPLVGGRVRRGQVVLAVGQRLEQARLRVGGVR